MSAIVIARVRATLVLHPLSSGRTKPCVMLCRDEAGNEVEVVVKWRAGLELKETGLVCELIAALLADDLDLPVPKPFVVEIETGFHCSLTRPEIVKLAEHSIGLNFGSQRLPPGVGTWPKDKAVPVMLRPLAASSSHFRKFRWIGTEESDGSVGEYSRARAVGVCGGEFLERIVSNPELREGCLGCPSALRR